MYHEPKKPAVLEKEFSSADRILDFDETCQLLKEHHLLIDDLDRPDGQELLR